MKTFWTDGSASPNPGPGGYAVLSETGEPVALGSEDRSSNIRMEGSALIAAMKLADGENCEIYTDSEFWINVLTKWAEGWERVEYALDEYGEPKLNKKSEPIVRKKAWKKAGNRPIQNLELVQEAYELYRQGNVKLNFVRGHMGTELNEKADEWANKARKGAKL